MKIEHIEWIDSVSHDGWKDKDDEYNLQIIRTVGFVICADNEKLVITSCSAEHHYGNVWVIPRVAILSRRVLE